VALAFDVNVIGDMVRSLLSWIGSLASEILAGKKCCLSDVVFIPVLDYVLCDSARLSADICFDFVIVQAPRTVPGASANEVRR
jgi:hypothetical protein